jgi:alpha-mannosidase
MAYEQLIVLLPCHSLEDFPLHHTGEAADSLLACWSALWHPQLLAEARRLPTWQRADFPSEPVANSLVLIPTPAEASLPAGWINQAQEAGAKIVRKLSDRSQLLRAALQATPESSLTDSGGLAADFMALGLGVLHVELLTRQMRYLTNIDQVHLEREALAAADAVLNGEEETTRTHLAACFEVLVEARERFYPVELYLIELTLVASSTLGESLSRQLQADGAQNLLLSGQLLEQLATEHPLTHAQLRDRVEAETLCVVGGEYVESELPLQPIENVLANFRRGHALFRDLLGAPPLVYARRRYGLSPDLPQFLSRQLYLGAVHATLDDGQFPRTPQSKVRWESPDGSVIDALGRLPLDARAPETFLSLPEKLAESMDMDHVATAVFAHWPGQTSLWFDDLRRISRYAPVFGRFITLSDYFRHTDTPGRMLRLEADEYRSPYLLQSVIRREENPIGRYQSAHQQASEQLHDRLLLNLASAAGAALDSSSMPADATALRQELTERTAASIAGPQESPGWLVLNPWPHARRVAVTIEDSGPAPTVDGVVLAAANDGMHTRAVVEIPGSGFAWFGRGAAAPKKSPPAIVDGLSLQNEFLRAAIDPQTGSLRSLSRPNRRGNLLSQQLAFRLPNPEPAPGQVWHDPDLDALYSRMHVDDIQTTRSNSVIGEITTHGELRGSDDAILARFVQKYRLMHGSKFLELSVELDPVVQPRSDPWNSYFALRWAWPDETAELQRSLHLAQLDTSGKRIEAPEFLQIAWGENIVSLLTGGLPFHRRVATRMLDTLLVVRGETRRTFQLRIGVNSGFPAPHAQAAMGPEPLVVPAPRPAGGRSVGWFFHLDSRNVVVTHWQPWTEGERTVGFRARLLETAGRPGRVQLRTPRPLAAAQQLDLTGEPLAILRVQDDTLSYDSTAHEWVEIEARYADPPVGNPT